MDTQKLIGILLLVGGALALAIGGFSYTRETHHADLGPLHMSVAEKQQVNIPLWAGAGAMLVGGLLLAVRRKA
ncbi:MAG TPA: LPXTG cell wall anchor domain-containing protein [Candidatus Binatia bacterium]|nr:LPXTG cell wall anchor domain-containing protein [Candidatus Binatia bacterium]